MKKELRVVFALVCAFIMLAGVSVNAQEQAFKGKIGKSLPGSLLDDSTNQDDVLS